jgi:hypothetical protein
MLEKKIIILFVFGLLFSSCEGRLNEPSRTTAKPESTKLQGGSQTLPELPKEIVIVIGRGGSNYGHIISINKKGSIQYGVGSSFIKTDESGDMTEAFNPDLIKYDERYSKKQKQLSAENITKLAELISDEEKLRRFDEKGSVKDDYEYCVYLDKKNVAFGYRINMPDFPKNLRSLINLILDEIEIHELPGMA